jgi:hypothetical protein
MATRTGVSTLRHLLREICKLVVKFPGLITNPDVPTEIGAAVLALITVCLASDFENPGSGEVTS